MHSDPKRILALFIAASQMPDTLTRLTYLDEECGTDAVLRQHVDALLNVFFDAIHNAVTLDRSAESPVEPGADVTQSLIKPPNELDSSTGTFPPRDETPHYSQPVEEADQTNTFASDPVHNKATLTSRLGLVIANRYTLIERIGEGGMGSVYSADQTEPVKRQVAIKLIKPGTDSRSMQARFDSERQALALMNHPNIARIFDGGVTQDGQLYFVMELVKGVQLTTYCDQHRLSVKDRLELFVAVCQAVQHAHQKGIIHRDLKPSNVIVTEIDGRPTPKVIDFGVAKAIDQKLTDMSFSDTGFVVGTPTYMSPEQADPLSMDIDTRTDVYALGVILYELLTGSTPIDRNDFKRGAMLEVLRMVREVDPPRPSTKLSKSDSLPSIAANRSIEPNQLSKLLRGELDWVVMKAVEKDRTRRYDTAISFAQDVQRFLADQVVEARPPSASYRIRKFIRRNKSQVVIAAASLLMLITALIVVAVLAVTADTAMRNAVTAKDSEEKQREKAENNYGTARQLAVELTEKVHSVETGLQDQQQTATDRKKALDSAIATFETFLAESPNDRTIQKQVSRLYLYSANILRQLNDRDGAEKAYSASIAMQEKLANAKPIEPEAQKLLAQALRDFALFLRKTGKIKQAITTMERAHKIAEPLKEQIAASAYDRTMGTILLDRASIMSVIGNSNAMEADAFRAAQFLDPLKNVPKAEQNPVDPILAADAHVYRAEALRELGRYEEAITEHNAAIASAVALSGQSGNRDVRHLHNRTILERAITKFRMGEQIDKINAELLPVLASCDRNYAEYPIAMYLELKVKTWLLQGEVAIKTKQFDVAKKALGDSLKTRAELLDKYKGMPDHIWLRAQAYYLLGRLASAEQNTAEAVKQHETAIKTYEFAVVASPVHKLIRQGMEEATKALQDAKAKPKQ